MSKYSQIEEIYMYGPSLGSAFIPWATDIISTILCDRPVMRGDLNPTRGLRLLCKIFEEYDFNRITSSNLLNIRSYIGGLDDDLLDAYVSRLAMALGDGEATTSRKCNDCKENEVSCKINGKYICNDCKKAYRTCKITGRYHKKSEMENIKVYDGMIWVAKKEMKRVKKCKGCQINVIGGKGGYCVPCFKKVFYSCNNCGATVKIEEAYMVRIKTPTCKPCGMKILPRSLAEGRNRDPRKLTLVGKCGDGIRSYTTGIEIEIANNANEELRTILWSAFNYSLGFHYDGSVNNGIEIVSPKMKGDKIAKVVRTICDEAIHTGEIDKTCGLHIHIDTSKFKRETIAKLIRFMYVFEKLFFMMNPGNRLEFDSRDQVYCKPLAYSYDYNRLRDNDFKKVNQSLFKENDKHTLKKRQSHNYDSARYFGLNIHAYHKHKTVEFRYFEGSLDPETILNWVRIVHLIISHIIKGYNETNLRMMTALKPIDLLEEFFKTLNMPKPLQKFCKDRYKKHGAEALVKYNALVRLGKQKGKQGVRRHMDVVKGAKRELKEVTNIVRRMKAVAKMSKFFKGVAVEKEIFSSVDIYEVMDSSRNADQSRKRILQTELKKLEAKSKLL